MVGIGFTEMIIIAGIALVVLGPEKFPEFAKIAIRAVRDIRGYFDEVKTEISKEIKPIEKEINEITRKGNEAYQEILKETEPSYTSKGYIPPTNYEENSFQTDYDKYEAEQGQDTSSLEEETSSTEPTKTNEGGLVEPYDPDVPHADLQKMSTTTPNNVEEIHENNEEIELNNDNELHTPERLDG
ncbi:MAG TPA: Sec-independent protein translocase protein TatB [Candidatus Hydrogenedens sp.]|nr:Sec-independent protein translocase protein TatB [Candidatus Hydrogenedens sp.]